MNAGPCYGKEHILIRQPLLHTWSHSLEDQFYLTWPLLILIILLHFGRKVLFAIAAAVCVFSLYHAQSNVDASGEYVFYMLLPRAWELLAGALFANANPLVSASIPSEIFFNEPQCLPIKDGVFAYRNANHLHFQGLVLLARHLTRPKL